MKRARKWTRRRLKKRRTRRTRRSRRVVGGGVKARAVHKNNKERD